MKFTGTDPIYIQIADYIKQLIDAGIFKKGEAIPSVRDFGMANGVNPNTVARAYEILVNKKLIVSIPKKGYFVNDEKVIVQKDLDRLERVVMSLLDEGYTEKEIIDVLGRKGK